jgi:hypothetical protein
MKRLSPCSAAVKHHDLHVSGLVVSRCAAQKMSSIGLFHCMFGLLQGLETPKYKVKKVLGSAKR